MDGLEARSAGGGRRARKKERTRTQIYAAAMELFVARGYDAVTIEDICAAADVARGTFFLHYPSKDSLLGEYGRQASAELVDLLDSHEGSAAEALEEGLRFLAERATRLAPVVRLVVRESAARPTAITDTTESGRGLSEIFAEVIRRGQRAGEFRKGVVPLVAGAILSSSYLVIAGAWARREDGPDLTALTRQALDVVLRGLAQAERRTRRKS
jgi:AcrR family transcriptional regulator